MNLLETAFLLVVDVSWRASCLVLLVYALRPVLRAHLPARLVFAAWIAVTVRLLLPIALPAAWSPFNLTPALSDSSAHRDRSSSTPLLDAPSALTSPASAASGSSSLAASASPAPSVSSLFLPDLSPLQWLAALWALGASVLTVARVIAWLRFTRLVRRGLPGPSLPALECDSDHPANLTTPTDRIRIIITDAVRAPALHGILQPRLLFPPGFIEGLTSHEFRLTVAHELAHARRRDLLVQGLLHLAAIVHWFNPLVWLVVRSARHDCELACDEAVLHRLPDTERTPYGAALMKIVTLAHGGTAPPRFGLGVVETKQHLKRRIEMIVTHPSFTRVRTSLGAALLVSLTVLSLTRELPAQSPSPSPAAVAKPATEPPASPAFVSTLPLNATAPAPTTIQPIPSPAGTIELSSAATFSGPAPAAIAPAARSLTAQPGTITFTPAATPAQPFRTLNAPPATPALLAASAERLAALYPSGTVATVADQTITVADLKRELEPLFVGLQLDPDTRTPEGLQRKLAQLQDSVVRDLIDRILVIKEFHRTPAGAEPRHIAEAAIDAEIADMLHTQFEDDRSRFLAYLTDHDMTMSGLRKTIEEQIIYRYMKKQERNVAAAKAAAVVPRDPRGSAHLRLIMLKRAAGETDDALRARAKVVLDRHKGGEKFEDLAREFSEDSRRERGGDWGWLNPSDLKASYREPLFSLKRGEVTTPLIMPEGCFLLYAEDRKP